MEERSTLQDQNKPTRQSIFKTQRDSSLEPRYQSQEFIDTKRLSKKGISTQDLFATQSKFKVVKPASRNQPLKRFLSAKESPLKKHQIKQQSSAQHYSIRLHAQRNGKQPGMNDDIMCIQEGSYNGSKKSSSRSIDKEVFPRWMRHEQLPQKQKSNQVAETFCQTIEALYRDS